MNISKCLIKTAEVMMIPMVKIVPFFITSKNKPIKTIVYYAVMPLGYAANFLRAFAEDLNNKNTE